MALYYLLFSSQLWYFIEGGAQFTWRIHARVFAYTAGICFNAKTALLLKVEFSVRAIQYVLPSIILQTPPPFVPFGCRPNMVALRVLNQCVERMFLSIDNCALLSSTGTCFQVYSYELSGLIWSVRRFHTGGHSHLFFVGIVLM